MKKIYHKVKRIKQGNFECGPASLAQLLDYYGCPKTIDEIIKKMELSVDLSIGTFDGFLGKAAIEFGFKARIITQNIYVFDPTWYKLSRNKLLKKLKVLKKNVNPKNIFLKLCVDGYIKFLKAGGKIDFIPLTKELLINLLKKHPLLIGISATYLYKTKRYDFKKKKASDISGHPAGHFLILNGYDPKTDKFYITDSWYKIPFSKIGKYKVKSDILINAMFLGQATYDCTVLEIEK